MCLDWLGSATETVLRAVPLMQQMLLGPRARRKQLEASGKRWVL